MEFFGLALSKYNNNNRRNQSKLPINSNEATIDKLPLNKRFKEASTTLNIVLKKL